jgi:hypothetical protein
MRPDDFKRVTVWKRRDSKHSRIMICTLTDGGCIAVEGDDEMRFLRGFNFITYKWPFWEETPEPSVRPMTRPEATLFLAQHPTLCTRYKEGDWAPVGHHRLRATDMDNYQWCTTEGGVFGDPHEFEEKI